MPTFSEDLRFRGIVFQVTDESLFDRLDHERLTLYIGFDPTNVSLHIGSLLQLATLRRFQLAGHRPIALAGGGTGLIGDPGGKSSERVLLDEAALAANLAGIRPQLARFIDLDDGLLLDNSAWLGPMGVLEFLRDVGKHFTVNQMVAKDSVRTRFDRPDQGISYTEFSYMLLQAYDFYRLHQDHGCELQVGGSDQWGNITMGIDLIRRLAGKPSFGLTTPLVTKADGAKFGKTESGTIWLDRSMTSPYRLYQFLLQTEDAMVGEYLRFFSFLSHDEIRHLDEATAERPQERAAQRALAEAVCALVHGDAAVDSAVRASEALFGEEIAGLDEATLLDVMAEAPSGTLSRQSLMAGEASVVDALVASGLVASKGEARRTLTQGGAYVNNRRVSDPEAVLGQGDLLHDRYLVLRRGRRQYHLVTVE